MIFSGDWLLLLFYFYFFLAVRSQFHITLKFNLGLKMKVGISFEYCYTEPVVESAITLLYVPLLSAGPVVCVHHGCGHPITGTQNHGWF